MNKLLIDSNIPKISIITSFFKADEYINHYLKNILNIKGYSRLCTHYAYNIVGSHRNNDLIKKKLTIFSKRFTNFKLIHIEKDPGLYELWNITIKDAITPYMMTLNIDDMCEPNYIVEALKTIEYNNADLVSCPIKVTKNKNTHFNDYHIVWYKKKKIYYDSRYSVEKQLKYANIVRLPNNKYFETKCNRFYKQSTKKIPIQFKKNISVFYKYYSLEDMFIDWSANGNIKSFNIPHCTPIWKRSLHKKYGYFNEEKYGPFADFEFWMRLLKNNRKYIQMSKPMVLYLEDDNSHNRRNSKRKEYMNRLKREYL